MRTLLQSVIWKLPKHPLWEILMFQPSELVYFNDLHKTRCGCFCLSDVLFKKQTKQSITKYVEIQKYKFVFTVEYEEHTSNACKERDSCLQWIWQW